MKEITYSQIQEAVSQLCISAAYQLPSDVFSSLKQACQQETSPTAKYALEKICANAELAQEGNFPLCQDTGMVVVFAQIGQDVRIAGGAFEEAVHSGVSLAYTQEYLRKSMVKDPLYHRENTGDNTPALIHTEIVPGNTLTLTVLPKGAGSENMSALKMLKPAEGEKGVVDFVVNTVVDAGGNPCPPTIVGVGIGGNAEYALRLSKVALQRPVGQANPHKSYALLEQTILEKLNESGIGPQGFGGKVSALAVHIETMPTHIASLPVGVSINCHAARHKQVVL